MKRPRLFISFIIIIIVGLTILQIFVSNSLSTKGISLGKIEDQIDTYQKENAVLREKLLLSSSLTTIASEAAEMGFIKDKSQIVLKSDVSIAKKP